MQRGLLQLLLSRRLCLLYARALQEAPRVASRRPPHSIFAMKMPRNTEFSGKIMKVNCFHSIEGAVKNKSNNFHVSVKSFDIFLPDVIRGQFSNQTALSGDSNLRGVSKECGDNSRKLRQEWKTRQYGVEMGVLFFPVRRSRRV